MWRYGHILAVEDPVFTLGEGATPLTKGQWEGAEVLYKLEFVSPTGSFKDRGISVMINYLTRCGISAFSNDSSGNAGASMSAYAAAAGAHCEIFVPATASSGKIIQMKAAGAGIVQVPGSRQDVTTAAMQTRNCFYASHNWHPLFLEGTKTIAYEIWESLGSRLVDNIVVPVGGGSVLLGLWMGFSDLLSSGSIHRMPRLFGVQAALCDPIHAEFCGLPGKQDGRTKRATVAEGIATEKPVRLAEVLNAVRSSSGRMVAVGEAEIVAAFRGLARQGLYVEPTSAAAGAGLSLLRREKIISPDERTLMVLTGSGLKASDTIGNIMG